MYVKLQALNNDQYVSIPPSPSPVTACTCTPTADDIKQRVLEGFHSIYPPQPPQPPVNTMTTKTKSMSTGINIQIADEKIDITPIMEDLAEIYEEMTRVTSRLHAIASEPTYSFFEEDFNTVVNRWNELTAKRRELLDKIVGEKEISDINEYMENLSILSKLNSEKNELIDELTTMVSIPFKMEENKYKHKIKIYEEDLKTYKDKIAQLNDNIAEASIHATNYSRIKDEEFNILRAKYNTLEEQYKKLMLTKNEK